MLKNLLKKGLFTLATASLLSTTLSAQTIYWGAGHTDATIDSIGSFTGMNASANNLGWTLNGNATHASATWSYTTTGISAGTVTSGWITTGWTSPMESSSVSTGAVMFDGDAIGVAINSTTIATGAHLISPAIDLSDAAGQYITLQFFTNFLEFNTDSFYVDLSLNGGTSYDYQFNINDYSTVKDVRANYNGMVRIPMVTALPSDASLLTDCRLRFRYKGILYFYALDEVSIIATPDKEVAIARPTEGTTLGNSYSTFIVSNNFFMPLSQVNATDSAQFGYGVKVVDNGTLGVTANDGLYLDINIELNNAGTWTTAHSERVSITQDLTEDDLVLGTLANNWVPTQVGEYRVTYTLGFENATDAFEDNNSHSHIFNITENYFSKVPTYTSGVRTGFPAATQSIFPAASGSNKIAAFEYGSMYFFPSNNTNTQYKIDSIAYTARYMSSASMGTNYNNKVTIAVKKFQDADQDGRINRAHSAGELAIQGLIIDSILAVPSATGQQEFAQMATNVLDVYTEEQLILEADEFYWVGFVLENASGLTDASGKYLTYSPGGYNFQTARNVNYGLNVATNIAVPTPIRVREIAANGSEVSDEWNTIGFGPDVVPSIGLYISENTVSVKDIAAINQFNIFPNPTADVLNVTLGLEEATKAQIIMTDVTGRVVRLQVLEQVQNETVDFNVADLSAGVYFISVKTNKGVSTQRFVKK